MTSHRNGRVPYGFMLGIASAGILLASAATVSAQENSFLDMLFGGQRQAAPAPAPAPSYGGQGAYGYGDRSYYRRQRAEHRRALRVKTRYAALPRPADVKSDISGKQLVDQKAIQDNPTKAILEDKTLRAGDIVVMPNGPKVFTGSSTKVHQAGDFEDVKYSRFLDRKTRGQLVAMMVPIGAMPADQARKVMKIRLKLAQEDEIKAVEAKNDVKNEAAEPKTPAMRKIMPWKTTTR